ncbi:hypothetical protein [Candidatus Solincola tengchongensis]|uniref:hypothetical protein n=1 Tax=Candidatus Solincola tengchongensis TaxID=2900693 RepID=UPI00257E28DF|nr:hypothetical protein [Candidatus Solincola tengchongensis]
MRGRMGAEKRFFRFLMIAGLLLVVYFTLTLVINMVYGVDLAGKGVLTVIREPQYQDGEMVDQGESVVLHGVSGWVAAFSPWLAVNGNLLALGLVLFGIGFALTQRREGRLAVTAFKLHVLAWYLMGVVLLMLVLGVDRVYFLPHAAKSGVLAWIDWYIFEFLAHLIWAAVVACLAVFFLRYGGKEHDAGEQA